MLVYIRESDWPRIMSEPKEEDIDPALRGRFAVRAWMVGRMGGWMGDHFGWGRIMGNCLHHGLLPFEPHSKSSRRRNSGRR